MQIPEVISKHERPEDLAEVPEERVEQGLAGDEDFQYEVPEDIGIFYITLKYYVKPIRTFQ